MASCDFSRSHGHSLGGKSFLDTERMFCNLQQEKLQTGFGGWRVLDRCVGSRAVGVELEWEESLKGRTQENFPSVLTCSWATVPSSGLTGNC